MRFPTDFTLTSDRCRLRAPDEMDFPHGFSASRVAGFNDGMLWDPPGEMAELAEPLARARQSWAEDRGYSFTIEDTSTERFVGRISIRREPEPEVWNLGFWTHPTAQRRGYMTEAAARIVDFGFTKLGAIRIEARHAVWNRAGERVLQKLGMSFLEHLPHGFQKRGQRVAENRLGITRAEWTMRSGLRPADGPDATPQT